MKKSWTPSPWKKPTVASKRLDEPADRLVELAEHAHQLLGLDRVGEARPAAEVGEDHRHLTAVTGEDRLVAGGDDGLGELRREEPLELLHAVELLELGLHALLERAVQLRDLVVVALDPEQRANAGEELVVVERLRDEVVRAGLDRLRLLGPLARRQHDHRQHGRVLARSELPADLEAVELRHHDVEQHEVRARRPCDLERLPAVARRDDLVATRHQHGLEEPDVLGDVVGDEYPGAVLAAHRAPRQCSSTVATKLAMFTGFET